MNVAEHHVGMGLVVNGVEGGDQVVALDLVDLGGIFHFKVHIGEFLRLCIRRGGGNHILTKVVPGKPAGRKDPCQVN